MRRDLAERVVETAAKMDGLLQELHEIGEELDDDAERCGLRQVIASLVCEIHEKIRLPALQQFPDLNPDRDFRPQLRGDNVNL